MNAGFSNLYDLKAILLPKASRSETSYDTQIQAIGKGVAAFVEKFCNRQFLRTVGATMTFPANFNHVILDRYPVEAITKVEVKSNSTDGFIEEADAIQNWDAASGWLTFGCPLSDYLSIVQVTFNGGYWWETKEPTDAGYPTTQPAGASALPDDIKLAWNLQCKHVWDMGDKLGIGSGEKPEVHSKLASLELVPLAKDLLRPFRRLQIV